MGGDGDAQMPRPQPRGSDLSLGGPSLCHGFMVPPPIAAQAGLLWTGPSAGGQGRQGCQGHPVVTAIYVGKEASAMYNPDQGQHLCPPASH